MNLKDPKKIFLYFIHEREAIRMKKIYNKPKPWTRDPILGKYRFCNVNREDDKVTQWIDNEIRRPFNDDPALWFALIVCRLINQPSTLARIYPVRCQNLDWNRFLFLSMTDPITHPKPIFNAAYIVSTNGITMQKNEYVARRILDPLWKKRPDHLYGKTCREWADWLLQFQGMGDFMVNQIVTDYKYTDICRYALDRADFVMGGPGTKRGLNRYFGRAKSEPFNRMAMQISLKNIRRDILNDCEKCIADCFSYDLNNLSNCFCEFDKYMRALTGEGRPKQGYTP